MGVIAVVGCGVQGSAVAMRMLGAGHDVVVWDRLDPRREEASELGARVAVDAASAIREADVVLTVVTAGPAAREVLLEPDSLRALAPGKLVVQMGTLSVEDTTACRQAVEGRGAELVSDVIHGVRAAIMEGQVLLLFGGSAAQHERVSRLLSPVGTSVPVGTAEQAAAFNAAGLCLLYALLHGFALGGAMVERSGIAPQAWCNHVLGASGLMGAMAGFFWPAHFGPRDYALTGPCQFKNDGAVEETTVIRDLVAKLGLDRTLAESFLANHRRAFEKSAMADFSSVYEELAPS